MSGVILSSDLWRLVLHHLRQGGCPESASALQRERADLLGEVSRAEERGRRPDLRFRGKDLVEILDQKDEMSSLVDGAYEKLYPDIDDRNYGLSSAFKLQKLLEHLPTEGRTQTTAPSPSPVRRNTEPGVRSRSLSTRPHQGGRRSRALQPAQKRPVMALQPEETKAMEKRIEHELNRLKPRPQGKTLSPSFLAQSPPQYVKDLASSEGRTFVNLNDPGASTSSAGHLAHSSVVQPVASTSSSALVAPSPAKSLTISPLKSRKSRVPVRNVPHPNAALVANQDPGHVKKALGNLSHADNDTISQNLAKPIAEMLSSDAQTSNASQAVENILNNDNFMENILNLLDDFTSSENQPPKENLLATPPRNEEVVVEPEASEELNTSVELRVDDTCDDSESPKKLVIPPPSLISENSNSEKPSHVRKLALNDSLERAKETESAKESELATASTSTASVQMSNSNGQSSETIQSAQKATTSFALLEVVESENNSTLSKSPAKEISNAEVQKEGDETVTEEPRFKTPSPQKLKPLILKSKRRPSPDFSHLMKKQKKEKAPPPEKKPVPAKKPSMLTRSLSRRANSRVASSFASKAEVLIHEETNAQLRPLSAHPNVLSLRGSGSACALSALAQSELQPPVSDLQYVCIDGETGAVIPLNGIEFVAEDGANLPIVDYSRLEVSEVQNVVLQVDSDVPAQNNSETFVVLGQTDAVVMKSPEKKKSPEKEVVAPHLSPPKKHVAAAVTPSKPSSALRLGITATPSKVTTSELFGGSPVKFAMTPGKAPPMVYGGFGTPLKTSYRSLHSNLPAGSPRGPVTPLRLGVSPAHSQTNSIDTPVLKDIAGGRESVINQKTPSKIQVGSASKLAGEEKKIKSTPGLKFLAEEIERVSSDVSASEDSMSPSRFQQRATQLREKVLRRHRRPSTNSASRKNIGIAIEKSLELNFKSPKKSAGSPPKSEREVTLSESLGLILTDDDDSPLKAPKRLATSPLALNRASTVGKKMSPPKEPLSILTSSPSSSGAQRATKHLLFSPPEPNAASGKRQVEFNTPQKSSPREIRSSPSPSTSRRLPLASSANLTGRISPGKLSPPKRPMFSSPLKNLAGSYIVQKSGSSDPASKPHPPSGENRAVTPVKLLLLGKRPSKPGRRVQLTPVASTSPSASFSSWETCNDVNNLDNYTIHKTNEHAPPKTPAKRLQEKEERKKERQRNKQIRSSEKKEKKKEKKRRRHESAPENNTKKGEERPQLEKSSSFDVNLELVPQITARRQQQQVQQRVRTGSMAKEEDVFGALGLVRKEKKEGEKKKRKEKRSSKKKKRKKEKKEKLGHTLTSVQVNFASDSLKIQNAAEVNVEVFKQKDEKKQPETTFKMPPTKNRSPSFPDSGSARRTKFISALPSPPPASRKRKVSENSLVTPEERRKKVRKK